MMLMKTTYIMAFLVLALSIVSISNFNENAANGYLKKQLQTGGFLKSDENEQITDVISRNDEDNA
jgi:hypothetical protein